jgi:beta-glucosidase/6-phospho-beta-glucosidase/beta-galactosidase
MKSLKRALRAYRNMIWAHARAYHAIHDEAEKLDLTAHVGLVRNLRIFDPLRKGSILDGFAAGLRDTFLNWHTLNSLRAGVMVYPFGFNKYVPEMENCFDFVGVNYCARQTVRFALARPLDFFGENTGAPEGVDSGREIDPDGLYEILASVSRFGKPVYITENVAAKDGPHERCRLIVSHMKQVYDAIRLGGDVQGYFLCLSRDDADSERELYRRICAENGLPADLLRRYCPDAVL